MSTYSDLEMHKTFSTKLKIKVIPDVGKKKHINDGKIEHSANSLTKKSSLIGMNETDGSLSSRLGIPVRS
jgi:hypothetical protein